MSWSLELNKNTRFAQLLHLCSMNHISMHKETKFNGLHWSLWQIPFSFWVPMLTPLQCFFFRGSGNSGLGTSAAALLYKSGSHLDLQKVSWGKSKKICFKDIRSNFCTCISLISGDWDYSTIQPSSISALKFSTLMKYCSKLYIFKERLNFLKMQNTPTKKKDCEWVNGPAPTFHMKISSCTVFCHVI